MVYLRPTLFAFTLAQGTQISGTSVAEWPAILPRCIARGSCRREVVVGTPPRGVFNIGSGTVVGDSPITRVWSRWSSSPPRD